VESDKTYILSQFERGNKMKITSLTEFTELKELNWNNPYTQRQFILDDSKMVKYLLENYRINFAFGFKYNGGDYSCIKIDNKIFVRNNNSYDFKGEFDQPIVQSIYDYAGDIDGAYKFVCK
jgi:hypothetical protein